MKKLEEIAKTFSTSRPIFRLKRSRNSGTISANTDSPIHCFRPTPVEGDMLSEIVCDHYREHFDIKQKKFTMDPYDIADKAMQTIRSSIPTFLERNLEMRNPRQSKVYRWYYRNLPRGYEFNDTLVMVYKYLRTFCDSDMRSSDIEHTKNAVALLGAIMEKYEEK